MAIQFKPEMRANEMDIYVKLFDIISGLIIIQNKLNWYAWKINDLFVQLWKAIALSNAS